MYAPVHTPELTGKGLVWINTSTPLSLTDLHGRLVILDFWTFCCINCIQIIPTLKRIERAFPDDVVVIGIHSPKFAAEADEDAVRSAVQRYDLTHPVVHDPHHILWNEYAVRAWPTMIFIGPDGKISGRLEGEPDPDRLEQAVGEIVADMRQHGTAYPDPLAPLLQTIHRSNLRFPGKIKPVPGHQRTDGTPAWAIADSGHHRVTVLDDSGAALFHFGSGTSGHQDGNGQHSRFNSPQGLICRETEIFVADTGNHAVRHICLKTGHVSTLCGTGQRGMPVHGTHKARGADLASPWDLELDQSRLWIANAGTHQILGLDLNRLTLEQIAGNGGEDILDGPSKQALLAQPSGLFWRARDQTLYFVDSETSSVRSLPINGGEVKTISGQGLFDFGLKDGPGHLALFQHPLGVCGHENILFVADSYNNTIRMVNTDSTTVQTIEYGQLECRDPVCLPLREPAGIWCDGKSRLLVSDTNNHRIVEISLHNSTMISWYL